MYTHNSFKDVDICVIKSICTLRGIKTRYRNKNKLINVLIEFNAVTRIQKSLRAKLMKYVFCPISHEYLRYPFVSIKHPNGHFNYFSLSGIAKWFTKNKEYICPNTRYKITREKLVEIDGLYYFYTRRRILKSETVKREDEVNQDIIWVSSDLINFVSNIQNIEFLTSTTIDDIVIPYIMNNLFFILNKNVEHALSVLLLVLEIINNMDIVYKAYIISKLDKLI